MPRLTRQEAVAEMVDGAIEAWLHGRGACAITLAGAAEGGMPKVDGLSAFELHRQVYMRFGRCSEKDAAQILTADRNWLKHFSEDKSETISTDQAAVQVLRTYLHFRSVYPDAVRTENMKLMDNRIHEHLAPVREMILGVGILVRRMMDALTRALPPPPQV